jgi:hypothetical protein
MTRICGVGLSGGLAIIEAVNGGVPTLIDVIDIPVVGTGAKQRVDVIAIRNFIVVNQPTLALIERAQAMPRQGSSSGFKYGRAVGAIEAAIAMCGIAHEIIEPALWKRLFKLPGKDKEAARLRALQAFPNAHERLARKKDHQRAEAMLIALYGAQR